MIPPPAPSSRARNAPHAITFFTTARERTSILRALRAIHPDRVRALQAALAIQPSVTGAHHP